MRTQLIAFLVATGVAAFGQTPDSAHTFNFAHTSTTQGMQEIATSIRTIAAMSEVSVDESKKSLTVHGTADQNALAEWMFTGMDLAAPAHADAAVHEYRMPAGADDVVRLFYLNRGQSIQDSQELVRDTVPYHRRCAASLYDQRFEDTGYPREYRTGGDGRLDYQ